MQGDGDKAPVHSERVARHPYNKTVKEEDKTSISLISKFSKTHNEHFQNVEYPSIGLKNSTRKQTLRKRGVKVDIGASLAYVIQNVKLGLGEAYQNSIEEQYSIFRKNIDSFNGDLEELFIKGIQVKKNCW